MTSFAGPGAPQDGRFGKIQGAASDLHSFFDTHLLNGKVGRHVDFRRCRIEIQTPSQVSLRTDPNWKGSLEAGFIQCRKVTQLDPTLVSHRQVFRMVPDVETELVRSWTIYELRRFGPKPVLFWRVRIPLRRGVDQLQPSLLEGYQCFSCFVHSDATPFASGHGHAAGGGNVGDMTARASVCRDVDPPPEDLGQGAGSGPVPRVPRRGRAVNAQNGGL